MLAFVAEQRFVLAAHVARLLDTSRGAAGRRLGVLREAGCLIGERPLQAERTAFRSTRRGLAAGGSDLPPPGRVDLATYRHEVGVTWLAVAARRGVFGELSEIVSERRMRSEDGRRPRMGSERPAHGVRLGRGADGRPRRHYPDLTIVTATGHRVAFELELSMKGRARRERILAAYAADRRIDVVVYLVESEAARRAVQRSAARVGAGDRVQVQRFAWDRPRAADAPGRARQRTARRAAGARAAQR